MARIKVVTDDAAGNEVEVQTRDAGRNVPPIVSFSPRRKYTLDGLDAHTAEVVTAAIEQANGTDWRARLVETTKIRDHYLGGERAKRECYHPRPEGELPEDWELIRRYLLISNNLTRKAANRFYNSLFSGPFVARVKENPHTETIDKWMRSKAVVRAFQGCIENAITYGTGIFAVTLNKGRLEPWIPDPVYTVIVVNPKDIRDVLGIIEFTGDSFRFVTSTAIGYVHHKGAPEIMEFPGGLGFVPVMICCGQDRTYQGDQYGGSLVAEAPETAIRVQDIAKNLSQLQKHQTAATAVQIGDEAQTRDESASGPFRVVKLTTRDGGGTADFRYEAPDANFEAVLKVIHYYITQLSATLGIPLDALDADVIEKNASAEAYKSRSAALNATVKRLARDFSWAFQELILIATGLLEWEAKKKPVDLRELEGTVDTEVNFNAGARPETVSETAQPYKELSDAGLMSHETAVRFFDPGLSDKEVTRQAQVARRRAEAKYVDQYIKLVEAGFMRPETLRAIFDPDAPADMTSKDPAAINAYQYIALAKVGLVRPEVVIGQFDAAATPEEVKTMAAAFRKMIAATMLTASPTAPEPEAA